MTASHRFRLALALAPTAFLTLAAGQGLVEAQRRRAAAPLAEAAWIWAADTAIDDGPEAFFAVRDVALAAAPERAELAVLADEEYWVFVNGVGVGGNRYLPGAPVDRYEVAPLLRRGNNRLLVELRSARGVGGLLARLTVPSERGGKTTVSDETWRIVRRHQEALLDPDRPLPEGSPPRLWGRPPLGRWGRPRLVEPLPRLDRTRRSRRSLLPQRLQRGPEGPWHGAPGRRATAPLGPWTVFDWGGEVVGYLNVGFLPDEEKPSCGLLWTSSQPLTSRLAVDPRFDPYAAVILGAPGRTWWTDARPRRFRYAYVLGLERVTLAEVYPVDVERAARLLGSQPPLAGLWGLAPPRLVGPVEHEVWGELQGLPGLGGRKAR